ETAGDEHLEPALDGAVVERAGGGDDAHVVEHRLAAVGGAAREVDLELAGQALAERVAHEMLEGGLGPRRDVELLVGAGAGEVARHDVADGVAARLAGGEPDRAEETHHLGHLRELDEVHLHVVAGGDVPPAPRVGLDDVAAHLELLGGGGAGGELHPHHLVGAPLALTVDAVVETHHAEHVFVDLAREVLGHCRLETLDVALLLGVEVPRCRDDWCDRHDALPLNSDLRGLLYAHPPSRNNEKPIWIVGIQAPGSSPISRRASRSATRRRRAWAGSRWNTSPAP